MCSELAQGAELLANYNNDSDNKSIPVIYQVLAAALVPFRVVLVRRQTLIDIGGEQRKCTLTNVLHTHFGRKTSGERLNTRLIRRKFN